MPNSAAPNITADANSATVAPPTSPGGGEVPPSGERQVFRALRRQLTDEDLSHPGVQKLILHMLEKAEADRDQAEIFSQRFHEADKQVAILQEQSKTSKAVDVAFGSGTTVGGAMIGAAFYFWGKTPAENLAGHVLFWFGLALVISAIGIKMIKTI